MLIKFLCDQKIFQRVPKSSTPSAQSLKRRADVLFDLIDALTVAGQVSSPVALSEQKPFRRKFCSVCDGLENGEIDIGEILSLLPDCMPAGSEMIAGYKIYAVDATANEHEQAETLPDRSLLKSNKKDPLRYGHKYSWLARLVNFGTSWVAPVAIERIDTQATDTKVAAVQVQELGAPALHPRPAGKGTGRQKNYHPTPRTRYPVVFKSKKTQKSPSASP